MQRPLRLLAAALVAGATATAGCTPSGPTIVLDPGHSGTSVRITDPATGVTDYDYPNVPELNEAWSVSTAVRDRLVRDGYRVVLTKHSATDTVSLRRRAEIANAAHAALAVSIHDDHGQSWSGWGGQVYPQRVGQYRVNQSGRRIAFGNAGVAAASQRAAGIVAAARAGSEGHRVTVTSVNFTGRPPLAAGNIPLVALFATVPWVYNEVGADPAHPAASLSTDQINRYAAGLTAGIERTVPRN
jgi:N-acetylmuramoyl-L-alanine amidase